MRTGQKWWGWYRYDTCLGKTWVFGWRLAPPQRGRCPSWWPQSHQCLFPFPTVHPHITGVFTVPLMYLEVSPPFTNRFTMVGSSSWRVFVISSARSIPPAPTPASTPFLLTWSDDRSLPHLYCSALHPPQRGFSGPTPVMEFLLPISCHSIWPLAFLSLPTNCNEY